MKGEWLIFSTTSGLCQTGVKGDDMLDEAHIFEGLSRLEFAVRELARKEVTKNCGSRKGKLELNNQLSRTVGSDVRSETIYLRAMLC